MRRCLFFGRRCVVYCFFVPGVILLAFYVLWYQDYSSILDSPAAAATVDGDIDETSLQPQVTTSPPIPNILFWHSLGESFMKRLFNDEAVNSCPFLCRFTAERAQVESSNVVVFNTYAAWDVLPEYRNPDQAWLLYAMEPPFRVPRRPDLNSLRFNWTMSYRFDADIVHRHSFKVVRRRANATRTPAPWSEKSKKVAWIASNCHTFSQREDYVRKLDETIPVDVYGKCGPLKCKPKGAKCYEDIGPHYYFYLAFENSICKDYSTEKLFLPLLNNMIPVVMGGVNYTRVAPPGSFINFADFRTPSDLGEYLNSLIAQPSLLTPFTEWKEHYDIERPPMCCTICEGVHRLFKQPPKFYEHIYEFLRKNVGCMSWKRKLKIIYEFSDR